jgi:hypothetical protein
MEGSEAMMRCPREEDLDWAAIRLQRAGLLLVYADSLPAEFGDLEPLVRHAGECVRCGEILRLLCATEGAQRADGIVAAPAAPGHVAAVGPLVLPLFSFTGIPAARAARSADSGSPDAGSAGIGSTQSVSADARSSDHPFVDDRTSDALEEYLIAADSPGAQPIAGHGEGDSVVLTLATQDQRYVVRIFPNQDGSGATAVLLGGDAAPEAQAGGTEQGQVDRVAVGPNFFLRVAGVDYPFDGKGYARLGGLPAEEIALIVA